MDHSNVLADVAKRVALLNEFRTDDFQDRVVRIVNDARENWRTNGELPRFGTDASYDALVSIASVAGSSPIAVRDACTVALDASEATASR